ncbi:hypothetical protein niasHS_015566 [Heterodera schachtii]|uniref:B30.2/SPRY domain-containing protein n=1 Tax=Heterodera schachtii TaxID=97005 RepID=A0ABD2I054_HETSC
MSSNFISSPNCFFRPTAEQAAAEEEVDKYEVFSWHGDLSDQLAAQFLVSDQQLLKECREKLANSELRETKLLCKNGELNAENKALKAELEKQKLMSENSELKAKVEKMEQEKQQQLDKKYVSVDVFNSLVERIKQLENRQNKEEGKKAEEKQQKESVGQQNKNTEQKLDGKYAVVDKNNVLVALVTSSGDHSPPAVVSAKVAKEVPNSKQQNGWDAKVCHKDIEIIGEKQLTINCKGNRFGWRSVFAKFPITNFCRPGIFYFEMKVIKLESFATIGFATKEVPLDASIGQILNSYGYRSDGSFGCNGINRPCKLPMSLFGSSFSPVEKLSPDVELAYKSSEFSTGDVVGCGIFLDTRLIFLTKNGQRMDYSSFFIQTPANSLNSLFPCVSLWVGDKIEANFGPNFKFNLATL